MIKTEDLFKDFDSILGRDDYSGGKSSAIVAEGIDDERVFRQLKSIFFKNFASSLGNGYGYIEVPTDATESDPEDSRYVYVFKITAAILADLDKEVVLRNIVLSSSKYLTKFGGKPDKTDFECVGVKTVIDRYKGKYIDTVETNGMTSAITLKDCELLIRITNHDPGEDIGSSEKRKEVFRRFSARIGMVPKGRFFDIDEKPDYRVLEAIPLSGRNKIKKEFKEFLNGAKIKYNSEILDKMFDSVFDADYTRKLNQANKKGERLRA